MFTFRYLAYPAFGVQQALAQHAAILPAQKEGTLEFPKGKNINSNHWCLFNHLSISLFSLPNCIYSFPSSIYIYTNMDIVTCVNSNTESNSDGDPGVLY